jgi:hypothetical protein
LLSASLVFGQEAGQFESGISLVHIDAEVQSAEGRPISGLQRGDFRIFDEGQEQPVSVISSSEEPLDMLLLIDTSRSMRPKVKEVAAAGQAALRESRPSDRLCAVSPVNLLLPFGLKRPGGIEGIVEKTGGDLIYSDDLGTAFPAMIQHLRSRYSLYYRLPDRARVGQERNIRIELDHDLHKSYPGAKIRARTRYTVQRKA